MKKQIFIIIILILIITFTLFLIRERSEKSDLIRVENIQANQIIQSPLFIKGEARGFWFFEADFPVKILDGDNNLLGISIAIAQEDWMTEEFVPFIAEIEFIKSSTKRGFLVLEKDNPTGLPEHDDQLIIPIRF